MESSELIGSSRWPWRTTGSVTLWIHDTPERLYDLVADVTSHATRSTEVQACHWLNGSVPGRVGARFRGGNRAGAARWSRVCEVVTADRNEQFSFRTVPERLDVTRRDSCLWYYRFRGDRTQTEVTHGYSLITPPAAWLLALYGWLMPQHRDPRPTMLHTLERLRAQAEQPHGTRSDGTASVHSRERLAD